MEQHKLTVTFTPVNYVDPIPRRVLTITEETDGIVIGRSSKASAKDLIPARDNAWFDSRVMSRSHAIIKVSPQKQEATIMDTESMHGTCLNGTKLVANNKTILMNRDVLTFGAKVTRGSESFEPLKYLLALLPFSPLLIGILRYRANSSEEPTNTGHRHSENTFVVPDDDDDDDEDFDDPDADDIFQQTGEAEALSPALSPDANSDAISIHSSVGGDKPKSSPPSSPPSKDETQDAANPMDKDSEPHSLLDKSFSTGDSVQLPIPAAPSLRPQRLAPHLTPYEHNLSKHLYHANTPDESDQVSDDDEEPYSPSDSEADRFDDSGSVHSTNASGARSPQSDHFNSAFPNTSDAPPAYEPNKNVYETYQSNVFPITNGPISNDIGYNNFHYSPREDRAPLREMAGPFFAAEQNETIHNPGWTLGMQRAPSPSDKAMAKPTTHENRAPNDQDQPPQPPQPPQPRFLPISSLPNPPYSKSRPSPLPSQHTAEDAPEFPHLPPIRPPYSDGPFTSPAHKKIGLSGDKCVPQPTLDYLRSGPDPWNSRRDDPMRGNSFFFNTPMADTCSPVMTTQESQSFRQDDFENNIPLALSAYYPPRTSHSDAPLKSSTLSTTIPVANMVDGLNQNTEFNKPVDSLKRKAPEIEEETELSDDNGSLPDAQPWQKHIRLVPSPDYFPRETREEPETSTVVSETQGPPQKKVKTETPLPSESSNFGRYAASAFVGVAVGGIGAIAALASLPPNFFG
ncbi:hypothetical protein FQN50_004096 [Emmonsiellopsis sp. PD_5]|nr:hypothetical protein FQN50_004096 [Emmonsiellopsis sp. PD_5]